MIILISLIAIIVIAIYLLGKSNNIGALAEGTRLEHMKSYNTFKNGVFENLENTPAVVEGVSQISVLKTFFFNKDPRNVPTKPIPVIQTDLKNIPLEQNIYVWFGHSSYYLQVDGKRILVDPVFSKHASPVPFGVKAFPMSYNYSVDDIPEIDILIITHDHFDHLDYPTIIGLKQKVKRIITSSGVGAHLEKWGYPSENIRELYWGESLKIDSLSFTASVSRHFSGRWLKRNTSLWSSFVLHSNSLNIFIGGDSGYGKHFKAIGEQYGPFDYVILENGQYNEAWKYIHLMPEEAITVAKELKATTVIPVHNSKFPLANHAWDEPMIRITKEAKDKQQNILTPQIGQIIQLNADNKTKEWWLETN